MGKLMHDFNCNSAEDMNFELMAERTKYLKENPEGVESMCKVMEDMRDKAREEGRKEGREEGRKEGREEGMDLFIDLIRKLTELGRTKDAERVFTDTDYRTQLFAEFSLQ